MIKPPVDLSVEICGIHFTNPFLLPSAQPVRTRQMIRRAFQAGWAGAVTQTISIDASQIQNVQPRLHAFRVGNELAGVINIDLISTRPLDEWEQDIQALADEFPEQPVIASLMGRGNQPDDWKILANRLQKAGARALELNLSCPHGMPERRTGAYIGQRPELTYQATQWVVSETDLPVFVKLTPNVTDIVEIALAARAGGAAGITAINNLRALAGIDIEHLEPLPSVEGYSAFGGYAGPGIKPVGLRCVAEIAQALPGVPIAGCGGIENWRDAVEYLCAGAWVTQIYTVVMEKGFDVIKELTAGLATYLLNKGFQRVSQLTGAILPKLIDHGALSLEYKVKASYHPDLCTRCGQCFIACEDTGFQAIRLDEQGYPRIVEENCDGCGLCVELCPVKGCMYLSNLV